MNQKTIIVIFVLLLLFLTACTSRNYDQNVLQDYAVGTNGVELEFVQGAPPPELNEKQNFDVQLLVHNQGAYDVTNGKSISIELLHDSALLNAYNVQGQQGYLSTPYEVELHGKSYSFQNGEQEFFSMNRFQAAPVRGSFERSQPELYATLCYPYETRFDEQVCIDTDITGTDVRAQSCTLQPKKTFSKGQGAPIAVTALETNFEAQGPYARPVFTFTIENKGDGIFYYEPEQRCVEPTYDQMYTVHFEAFLSNTTLNCQENILFLDNGVVEVDCFLPGEGILLSTSSYLASLSVDINYQYKETYQHSAVVERQSRYFLNNNQNASSCAPWEVFDQQKCISRCEYCADNSADDECISNDELKVSPGNYKKPQENYGCIYSEKECANADDTCIREDGRYCVPGLFCGVPECTLNDKRNDKPQAELEVGIGPARATWYCSDKETTPNLKNFCGCSNEAQYTFTTRGVDCPQDPEAYQAVQGSTSTSLRKTYYSVERTGLSDDLDTLCVIVSDNMGKTNRATLPLN